MSSKNKFGFAAIEPTESPKRRTRAPGPMGTAVRDVAENLAEATEVKVEQRRKNAEDAKEFRRAQQEGRVLVELPLAQVATDDLPRDRLDLEAVAQSDEMEELKASIRERGQREPIEVYLGADGRHQLKKGWRRYTALTQLFAQTGEEKFATIIARVEHGGEDRIGRYVDMVEENVVREDLTFAEMAQVAITAAQDDDVDEIDPSELVSRLYDALHKTKRSYIKSFVFLLSALGEDLQWPKAVPRNLGVDVARALKEPSDAEHLRKLLARTASPEEQNKTLKAFLDGKDKGVGKSSEAAAKQKFEFFVGNTKVTAREGECRLVSGYNFSTMPKQQLEAAVRAFEAALGGGPRIR